MTDFPFSFAGKGRGQPIGPPSVVKRHLTSDVEFAQRQRPVWTRTILLRVPRCIENEPGTALSRQSAAQGVLKKLIAKSMHQAHDNSVFGVHVSLLQTQSSE
jgi:hypothetical protein